MFILKKIVGWIDEVLIRYLPGREKKNKILRKRVYHIGRNTSLNGTHFGAEPELLWIGDNVIAGIGTMFIEHDASYLNVCRYMKENPVRGGGKYGSIIVRDNAFIGANSIIMGGADIGENSIIAACSLVKHRIPPNEVWGGVPAHFIMTLDEYAKKEVRRVNELPWVKSGENVDMTDEELKGSIQTYYLLSGL